MKVLLGEFDLSHIEVSDSADLVASMNNCGCLPLSLRQDYIGKILTRRDNSNLLEIVLVGHLGGVDSFGVS